VLLYLSGSAFGLWQGPCGNSYANRVAGGDPTAKGEWPWMVKLYFCSRIKNSEKLQCNGCGGSLISDQWIMTAAHCIDTKDNENKTTLIMATVGGDDPLTQRNFTFDTTKNNLHIHESYMDVTGSPYDIALIKLDVKLSLNNNIEPVCIFTTKLPDISKCVATGYGTTESGESSRFDPSIQLCAQNQFIGNDVCHGDSGGPLTCEIGNNVWVQTGIVSFGEGVLCGKQKAPAVFTRVDAFKDWIEKITFEPVQNKYYGGKLYDV
ncbi:unnamed protein product, partial [Medioppia subpectinata]